MKVNEAIKELKGLKERWDNTEEWHDPPFYDGTIKVTTKELHAISVLLGQVNCVYLTYFEHDGRKQLYSVYRTAEDANEKVVDLESKGQKAWYESWEIR